MFARTGDGMEHLHDDDSRAWPGRQVLLRADAVRECRIGEPTMGAAARVAADTGLSTAVRRSCVRVNKVRAAQVTEAVKR